MWLWGIFLGLKFKVHKYYKGIIRRDKRSTIYPDLLII